MKVMHMLTGSSSGGNLSALRRVPARLRHAGTLSRCPTITSTSTSGKLYHGGRLRATSKGVCHGLK